MTVGGLFVKVQSFEFNCTKLTLQSKIVENSKIMALGLSAGGVDNIILCADSYKVSVFVS